MKTKSLGFIGGGRITRIFLQAFDNKNCDFQSIMVFDSDVDILNGLQKQHPHIEIAESPEQVASHPTLILALHPPMIMNTLDKIGEIVSHETLLLSLAPKITIEKMASKLRTENIARLIPNATSYINEGYNPISFAGGFNEKDKGHLLDLLKILGHTFEVPEFKLEAYALISAMLPTYFWFQWRELAKLGGQMGMSEMESEVAIHQTLTAAVKLMYQSGLTAEQVMDLIPVKPLEGNQEKICDIYQKSLTELYNKIKP